LEPFPHNGELTQIHTSHTEPHKYVTQGKDSTHQLHQYFLAHIVKTKGKRLRSGNSWKTLP